jgi:hypothetical protein
MALDTQQKLQAAAGVARKWRPGVVLLEAAAFDQGDLQVIGNSIYEPLATDTTPPVAPETRIVEPVDVSHEWIRPVRVEPFTVLRFVGLLMGVGEWTSFKWRSA